MRLRPTLRLQVIALAVLVALLGGGVVGLVVSNNARATLSGYVRDQILDAGAVSAGNASGYMYSATVTARELATDSVLAAAAEADDLSSASYHLEQWHMTHPDIEVDVVDLDGVLRATSRADKKFVGGQLASEPDWMPAALANPTAQLGRPDRDDLTDEPRVPYAVRVMDRRSGSVRGVLMASIALQPLADSLVHATPGSNTRIRLDDVQHNLILAHTDGSRVLTTPPDSLAIGPGQNQLHTVAEGTNSYGVRVLFAMTNVAGLPWVTTVSQPVDDVFAPVNEMTSVAMKLIAGVVAVAAVVGTLLALRIVQPLSRLRATVELMAGGDLTRRVGLNRDDETGQLAAAFDHMAEQLQLTIARANEGEARIRAILNSVGDGIIRFDENGYIDTCNPAAERLFGYAACELIGQSIDAVLRKYPDREQDGYRKDGTSVPLEVTTSETVVDGKPSFIVVARDVSARREAEAQREALAQSEKLRALGQMASGIAHDLNQSLMLVAAYGDLARAALQQPNVDLNEVRKLVTTTTQAALDGGETVKRLLLFTRAPFDAERQAFDLTAVARDAVQLTAPRWRDAAQAEGRPISLHIESSADPIVEGSAGRMREVLTNLIFNAVDAMPRGGSIRITVGVENGTAVLSIRDSGVGMTPELQARIFEPFFTTKGASGTGLGLAMVFGIVEQHGGRIDVQSAPGMGTTFRISLPSCTATAVPAGAAVREAPAVRGTTRPLSVLAVDDEPAMTQAVVRMLRPSGHHVTVAASGEEAINKLSSAHFDVIVSDMGMGAGMNGWELANVVRARWPGVRFVLATGWGAAIETAEAQAKGVQAVLAKPYRPADLEQVLASLDGERLAA